MKIIRDQVMKRNEATGITAPPQQQSSSSFSTSESINKSTIRGLDPVSSHNPSRTLLPQCLITNSRLPLSTLPLVLSNPIICTSSHRMASHSGCRNLMQVGSHNLISTYLLISAGWLAVS